MTPREPPFCTDIEPMPIKTSTVQIGTFCAAGSRVSGVAFTPIPERIAEVAWRRSAASTPCPCSRCCAVWRPTFVYADCVLGLDLARE
jgi:hypothetical protein